MILTVTLNPAIDKLLVLNEFTVHKLHRLESDEESIISAGGKGINIAINLNTLHNDVIASGFAAGHAGHLLVDELHRQGLTTSFVFTEGLTRTNISILDKKNETLSEINDRGHSIPPDDLEFFLGNYKRMLNRVKLVVLGGSLPLGVPTDFYIRLIEIAREKKIKVVIHTAPQYLDPVLSSSPFMIIPDMRSHHELLGKHCDGITEFNEVGKDILVKNRDTEFVVFIHRIENVVVVSRDKTYVLRPQNLKIVNMLGYSDAYIAGFIDAYCKDKDFEDILLYASAAGLSNVEALHKELCKPKCIAQNLNRFKIEIIK